MATSICNPLTVAMPAINSGTPAASRTFTTTRLMRLFDLKGIMAADQGGAVTFTVANGATTCITKVTGALPGDRDVVRLGDNASDTVDDAQMAVSAGGTIVCATDNANSALLYITCYPI